MKNQTYRITDDQIKKVAKLAKKGRSKSGVVRSAIDSLYDSENVESRPTTDRSK